MDQGKNFEVKQGTSFVLFSAFSCSVLVEYIAQYNNVNRTMLRNRFRR